MDLFDQGNPDDALNEFKLMMEGLGVVGNLMIKSIFRYMFIVVSPVSKWKKSLAPQNLGDREGRAM